MTGAAVVVALAVVAVGGALSVWRRTFVPGMWTQAVGALLAGGDGVLGARGRFGGRRRLHERLRATLGVDG